MTWRLLQYFLLELSCHLNSFIELMLSKVTKDCFVCKNSSSNVITILKNLWKIAVICIYIYIYIYIYIFFFSYFFFFFNTSFFWMLLLTKIQHFFRWQDSTINGSNCFYLHHCPSTKAEIYLCIKLCIYSV